MTFFDRWKLNFDGQSRWLLAQDAATRTILCDARIHARGDPAATKGNVVPAGAEPAPTRRRRGILRNQARPNFLFRSASIVLCIDKI